MSKTNINTTLPFHQVNPLSAFSERGVDYANYRPGYPTAAIDRILEGLGNPSALTAADIGAGTGIASRLLADRGVSVKAIEPNASMRNAAIPHPLVEFYDATAEATKLPEASVDLIACFQSFHWFKPKPTLSEFHRILKPTGRLAIVWSSRAVDDEFSVEFDRLVKASMSDRPADQSKGMLKRLLSSNLYFTNVRCHKFTNTHELDLDGTIGYALSKSFVPREGAAHQKLLSDLQELYARYADERGYVKFVYYTNVFLAEPQLHNLGRFSAFLPQWLFAKWQG